MLQSEALIRAQQGDKKMKNTGNRRWGKMFFISGLVILSFGIQIVLWAPHISAPAHAQGYNHVNWYHAQASVAEKELRAKEEKAREEYKNCRQDVSTDIAVTHDQTLLCANDFDTADSPEDPTSKKK
jgi:hypothetical protein